MDNVTLSQIKELGVPAFCVIILVLTAAFLIRNAIQERAKSQAIADDARTQFDEMTNTQQERYDALQKSFTDQLLNEKKLSEQREASLLSQLTQTNQRVVDAQLEIGTVRSDLRQSLVSMEALTKERDQANSDYARETKARQDLEKRVTALESDLEKSKNERRDLSNKYQMLKKEHDALVAERNKLIEDIAQLKRQTQTIPKVG